MNTVKSTIENEAVFSDDGKHRLLLRKVWEKDKKSAMVIMINPNVADTMHMDLTTMLVVNNLSSLGFGGVNIVNLYSRIMNKLSLRFNSDEDLIDNENDAIIKQYAEQSDAIIIAWGSVGNHSQRVRDRQSELLKKLAAYENKMYKIGEEGYHPLTPVVRCEWELEPYELGEMKNAESKKS